MDKELENLRKKRLKELQQQATIQESIEEQDLQRQEFDEQKKMILRAILDTTARERLARIKIARPELAESIENQLIMLAQGGKLKNKINDEQLRMLLARVLPKKRDINIKRR